MILNGLFDFSLADFIILTLLLTHITIVSVTVFLHRHQAHRALELHPLLSHFFSFLALVDHRYGDPGMGSHTPQASCDVRNRE